MSANTTNNAAATSQLLTELYEASLENDSATDLKAALDIARNKSGVAYTRLREKALHAAVNRGLCSLTDYLLNSEDADLAVIQPHQVANSVSISLLNILHLSGWDLNTVSKLNGFRLINLVTKHEDIVRWLCEHGASVDEATETSEHGASTNEAVEHSSDAPTSLESCATHGSLSTFIYLQERGGRFGPMTLHRAAERAAAVGAEPCLSRDGNGISDGEKFDGEERKKIEAEKILQYLVDTVGLDVNRIESDKPMLYGTPINRAAWIPQGAGVVNWLLRKGADPTIFHPQCRGEDVEQIATSNKCENTIKVLEDWKREKGQSAS